MATSASWRSASTVNRRLPFSTGVALAHGQRLDPADLVGSNKDQLGLDPALVRRRIRAVAARKCERARQRRGEARSKPAADGVPSGRSRRPPTCGEGRGGDGVGRRALRPPPVPTAPPSSRAR